MEFAKIRLRIYLVSIALLLLIAVQLFWAFSSFKLSEKTFYSNVREAMRKTVATSNENLNCFELFSKTQLRPGEGVVMIKTKKNNNKLLKDSLTRDTIPLFFEYADDKKLFNYTGIDFSEVVNMESVLRFHFIMDTVNSENKYLSSTAGIDFNNFRDRFSDKTPIYKKYDTLFVDSVLKHQLLAYSISEKFHFGYINSEKKKIEYRSSLSDDKKILASPLRIQLTDNRYFINPHDLVIYFDNKNSLILTNIRAVLILSGLVILILLVSFYVFIRIVYKQRKLSELKNDFVNNMTHEFKTPLANISIVLETLSEGGFSESKNNEKALKILGQETDRLRENIEKILQVARFEKEKIHLSFERLDIHQLLQNAMSPFDVVVSSQNVEIDYDLKATNHFVKADETHLINVISNLIDNAIKYSKCPVKILIKTHSSSDGVFFSIKDNGQGIGKDAQKRIYEKFYREPNGNVHTIKGFGLGLTYVKTIIDSHRGKINLISQVGTGSEFEIYLPYEQ